MKVSTSWLSEYVSVTMPTAELAEALTMVGLEVDGTEDRYQTNTRNHSTLHSVLELLHCLISTIYAGTPDPGLGDTPNSLR